MADEDPNAITIKVQSEGIGIIPFRVKRTTKMGKVLNAFCKKCELDPKSVVWHSSEGTRINDTDTPESLDLEDDDVIDAQVHQIGGMLLVLV